LLIDYCVFVILYFITKRISILFYFILFYFILFYFILFYFILFYLQQRKDVMNILVKFYNE